MLRPHRHSEVTTCAGLQELNPIISLMGKLMCVPIVPGVMKWEGGGMGGPLAEYGLINSQNTVLALIFICDW